MLSGVLGFGTNTFGDVKPNSFERDHDKMARRVLCYISTFNFRKEMGCSGQVCCISELRVFRDAKPKAYEGRHDKMAQRVLCYVPTFNFGKEMG
ncbi:hypothetical protein CDAR_280391 [Caerostris darwini]|uniref:Uncharacterized protein n=1 Tax=Caerostris darwini TaxID=1538125 RepID=A0AAV4VFB1_9ARAC|nr:hypothetical protein CDAR_280391 [Caerostris darwini]